LFRHSRTTHLLRIGVPEVQVAKLLGWRTTRMLERYAHLVSRDAYAALLRAHGYEPPKAATHESLMSAEGELRPVVPIVPAPSPKAASAAPDSDTVMRSRMQEIAQETIKLMKSDPELLAMIAEIKRQHGEDKGMTS